MIEWVNALWPWQGLHIDQLTFSAEGRRAGFVLRVDDDKLTARFQQNFLLVIGKRGRCRVPRNRKAYRCLFWSP